MPTEYLNDSPEALDGDPWDDEFARDPWDDEFQWEPLSSEVAPRTDPVYWFLTREEIERTRGSGELPRTLSVYTSNNLVQPLIDGEQMMRAIRADIAAAGRGDFIHFTAWRMTRDMELVPGSGDTVERLWTAAIRRGAMSRTLLWRPIGGMLVPRRWLANGRDNADTQRLLERAGGQAVLDARFPRFGSHHQKSGVVLRAGEAVAYCGGIDLAPDRWDTQRHDSPRGRRREMYDAWHDVHTRVRGPAVHDIELNFRDRWNDTETPSTLPPVRPPPRITGTLPPVAMSPGTHHVQVLRTFACGGNYRTFAPAGEQTCLAGYRKAIARAESYIYIEDQYLVFDELARDLDRALNRIRKLVIVVPRRADMAEESFHWHQANFIRILRSRHPGKVHVYHLVQPGTRDPDGGGPRSIYVHCKLMIVDDIYAVIGSSNIGRRSMTYDSELDVAVVDADVVDGVCRFARDLRRSLWGEHLNLPPSDRRIADPIAGVGEWERQATAGTSRVRRHVPPSPQDEQPLRWNQVYDPDGRCPTDVPLIAAAAFEDRELALAAAEQLEPWLAQECALPGEAMASLFEAACGSPAARRHWEQQFDIVAGPGSVLSDQPQPGDVLVRCPLGEGIREQFAVLATGELLRPNEAIAAGLRPESSLAGLYAEVIDVPGGNGHIDCHSPVARRLGDASGRLPLDSLLVRPLGELLALAEKDLAEKNPPRRRRAPTTTITFDEPTVVTVPVTRVGGRGESAGEREVEAELNSLRGYFAAYWDNYHAGLNNFETAMQFASDDEAQPRYFDVALKEVGKLLLEQAITYAFQANPVLAAVATGVKNIALAWYDEAQRAQQAAGDRRIAHYIAEIRNQAGTQQGPHLRMLRILDESRPGILDDYRAAVSRTNIPQQGQQGVLTGEAAVFLQQLRQSVQRFHQAIPPAARFAQLFTERFAGSQVWTRRSSHGGRPGGMLYLDMQIHHRRSGGMSQWSIGDVDSAWTLATTAPRPDRLATSLRTALQQQGKAIWQTNLPKRVHMQIGIHDGFVRFTREPTDFQIGSHYGHDEFRQAWQQPRIRQRALGVSNLRGSND